MVRLLALLLFSSVYQLASAQAENLGLSDGVASFDVSSFTLQLVKDSQTAFSLKPKSSGGKFDFLPFDAMTKRSSNGQYHLGDITFRVRRVGTTSWSNGDSAQARAKVTPLAVSGNTLAAANLSPTLPANSLLKITRRWVNSNGKLQLLFDVTNNQNFAVEIGAIGAPLEFNNASNIHCYHASRDKR
jgi:hypothetical protein